MELAEAVHKEQSRIPPGDFERHPERIRKIRKIR